MRTDLAVGQVYELPSETPLSPARRLCVVSVHAGVAVCEVLVWKGRPRLRGTRCFLPDDARYLLVPDVPDKPIKTRSRRGAR